MQHYYIFLPKDCRKTLQIYTIIIIKQNFRSEIFIPDLKKFSLSYIYSDTTQISGRFRPFSL